MKLNYKSHGLTWLDLVPYTKEKEKRKKIDLVPHTNKRKRINLTNVQLSHFKGQ